MMPRWRRAESKSESEKKKHGLAATQQIGPPVLYV